VTMLLVAGVGAACQSSTRTGADCGKSAEPLAAKASPALASDLAFVVASANLQEIYTASADGTRLHRLARIRNGGLRDLTWSPNGREIAFERDRGFLGTDVELWIAEADVSGARKLVRPAGSRGIEWSPDGSKIAFERWAGEEDLEEPTDIWMIGADGTGTKNLTPDPAIDSEPAWSPDGQTIAFRREQGQTRGDIWAIDADGACPRNLTPGRADEGNFAWSPDGTKLAFVRKRSLYMTEADGTNVRRLTTGLDVRGEYEWSPDGKAIVVVVGWTLSERELFVVAVDGSGIVRLTDNDGEERGPVWSPDGARIAFMSWPPDETYEIHTIDADGTNERRLTHGTPDYYPDWSPDGTKIAFSRDDYGGEGPGRIWVVNADGSDPGEVTRSFGEGRFFTQWSWRPQRG
jgi:Tol biopolymer transport system component